MAKGPVTRAEFNRMETRMVSAEKVLSAITAYVASKQRAEAQAKIDDNDKPIIYERDESGEPWLRSS